MSLSISSSFSFTFTLTLYMTKKLDCMHVAFCVVLLFSLNQVHT
jgi:hypothetical protein